MKMSKKEAVSKKETSRKEPAGTGKKEKKEPAQKVEEVPVKVVLRRLPKCITEQEVLDQCSPLPENLVGTYFSPANPAFDRMAFATLTLVFREYSEPLLEFERRFDGYTFVDSRGNDSVATVEAALNQHFSKCDRARMRDDPRVGIIVDDEYYIKFCESLDAERARPVMTIEQQLRKLARPEDARTQIDRMETPLVKYYLEKETGRRRDVEARKLRRDEKRAAYHAVRASPGKTDWMSETRKASTPLAPLAKELKKSAEPKKTADPRAPTPTTARDKDEERMAKRKEKDLARKKKFLEKRKEKKEEQKASSSPKHFRSPAKTIGEQQGDDWIKKLTDPSAASPIKRKHDIAVAAAAAKLTTSSTSSSSSPTAPPPIPAVTSSSAPRPAAPNGGAALCASSAAGPAPKPKKKPFFRRRGARPENAVNG